MPLRSWARPAHRSSVHRAARLALGAALSCAMIAAPASAKLAAAQGNAPSRQRLVVLTDIGTEVDDQQSIVRLLVYANEFDIEGLVATTSSGLPDRVYPNLIEERIRAYGDVLGNLRAHAPGFPDAQKLLGTVRASSPTYGMGGVGEGKDTAASKLIVEAADRPDPRPLWITVWGGSKDLAQALWSVRATRGEEATRRFVARLRVYSVSEQDDAGPWIRSNFPDLFYIADIHAFRVFELATWTGMSNPMPGADPTTVQAPWLQANVVGKGPLGALYPMPHFGMEGDTPSFLYLLPNGLGSPEHPNWGSWGGRYGQVAPSSRQWASTVDKVRLGDGTTISDNRASVWRWRNAFQNDFAARMTWSVTRNFAAANHPPRVRLNGRDGDAPQEVTACPGQTLTLSAAGSSDPDRQPLAFKWWQYAEATGFYAPALQFSGTEGETVRVTVPRPPRSIKLASLLPFRLHAVVEASDNGTPALTRYRRTVITVAAPGERASDGMVCK